MSYHEKTGGQRMKAFASVSRKITFAAMQINNDFMVSCMAGHLALVLIKGCSTITSATNKVKKTWRSRLQTVSIVVRAPCCCIT